MTCRVFTDPSGREWNVWAVQPELFASSLGLHRSWVAAELARGWLAFEVTPDATEKRRLAPVPPDWEGASDAGLVDLWERATPVPARLRQRFAP